MNPKQLARERWIESKKMNGYFRPCDFQQYSLGAVIQAFVGNLGTVELAVVDIENSVTTGLDFRVTVKQ